ncbi:hypothetical protein EHQ59_13910 [Leptospira kemamanensis]|uniref:Lipoprotein n=1 Tax=Leptospira kemamanensis TaxID=2484942 RepID=A0A4R9JQX9_9LEPT|nr:hypothetical protein [Leptospira kemamanensis]TGL50470.1 hypothetical protein EHQ59_13910 [Leptospira kemamanensis]
MKSKIIYYIALYSVITFVSCKEKDWREDPKFQNQELESKLLESQKLITSKKKEKYILNRGFSNKEEAIKKFLSEIKNNKVPINSFVSWEEQLELIFPNTYGLGTALDHTPLNEYQVLLSEREKIAINSVEQLLTNGYKIEKFIWESPKRFNQILGYKPKVIISTPKGQFEITQIKMVYDIDGKFIVGVLGP